MRAHFRPFPGISFARKAPICEPARALCHTAGPLQFSFVSSGFNLNPRALKARAESVAFLYTRAKLEERAPETVNSYKKKRKEEKRDRGRSCCLALSSRENFLPDYSGLIWLYSARTRLLTALLRKDVIHLKRRLRLQFLRDRGAKKSRARGCELILSRRYSRNK